MARRERLPKGSVEVIEVLKSKGNLTQKAVIEELEHVKPRSVRYTIRQLIDRTILTNIANFNDMRSSLIGINPEMDDKMKELIEKEDIQLSL